MSIDTAPAPARERTFTVTFHEGNTWVINSLKGTPIGYFEGDEPDLGQRAAGILDVYDGAVRLEVTLPWLLARFAQAAQRVIGQKGQLMLEKK